MNSREQVMKRLLRLFPKEKLNEHFGEKAIKKEDLLLAIISETKEADILTFINEYFKYTKQHIYIYTCNVPDYNKLPERLLSCPTIKNAVNNTVEYYCLFEITYQVYFREPEKRPVNLVFQWPICISVGHSLVVVSFTILEKNIQSYFKDATVLTTRKNIDEKGLLVLILNELAKISTPILYDLNKGIKELWRRDIIDAVEIQYKKSASKAKEIMDEEYTFKQKYPEQYEEANLSPLNKSIFKFLQNSGDYCDHFTVDPTLGEITFPMFSKNKEQTQNVIRKILELN